MGLRRTLLAHNRRVAASRPLPEAAARIATAVTLYESQAARVAVGDGAVVGVSVPVHLLRVGVVDDRVDGEEAADGGVVGAGAHLDQTGGVVFDAGVEAEVGRPGGDVGGAAAWPRLRL